VRTKGFRGEALASIAAVAQVEMNTKRVEDETGTHIIIEGSEVKEHGPAGCQDGSTIMVKNLYFNIPARRNFLKSNPVETRHIIEEFLRVAISHADIQFTFHHNGSEVYHLPEVQLRQRLVNVFGKQYNQKLVPFDEETDVVKLTGFIGKPEFAKKTRGEQYFFVNNRFIKSPYLHHAIQHAFQDLIQSESYPAYFVFMQIDPSAIDINIHPTKTEVKFEDEKVIYAIINSAAKRSLGKYNISPTLDFEQEAAFTYNPEMEGRPIQQPTIHVNPNYNPFRQDRGDVAAALEGTKALYGEEGVSGETAEEELPEQRIISSEWENDTDDGQEKVTFQLHNNYILSQIKSGLLVIDQHLAHERILYERFLGILESNKGPSQQLLFPETIELKKDELLILEEMQEDIMKLGFDIRDFGKNTVVIHGRPPDVPEGNIQEQVEELLQQIKENRDELSLENREGLARAMARNMSIASGKKLSREEMDSIINELFACKMPYTSPAGKPTITTLTLENIQHKFQGK